MLLQDQRLVTENCRTPKFTLSSGSFQIIKLLGVSVPGMSAPTSNTQSYRSHTRAFDVLWGLM